MQSQQARPDTQQRRAGLQQLLAGPPPPYTRPCGELEEHARPVRGCWLKLTRRGAVVGERGHRVGLVGGSHRQHVGKGGAVGCRVGGRDGHVVPLIPCIQGARVCRTAASCCTAGGRHPARGRACCVQDCHRQRPPGPPLLWSQRGGETRTAAVMEASESKGAPAARCWGNCCVPAATTTRAPAAPAASIAACSGWLTVVPPDQEALMILAPTVLQGSGGCVGSQASGPSASRCRRQLMLRVKGG